MVCSILGLKKSILDAKKKKVFSPIVQYTCIVINLEKNLYFPKSCSIFEVFSSQTVQKTVKKKRGEKVTLGISVAVIYDDWMRGSIISPDG